MGGVHCTCTLILIYMHFQLYLTKGNVMNNGSYHNVNNVKLRSLINYSSRRPASPASLAVKTCASRRLLRFGGSVPRRGELRGVQAAHRVAPPLLVR